MVEVPEHITVKSSFRKSKASEKVFLNNREYFLSCTKANKGVYEIYDVSSGILIAVSCKDKDGVLNWIERNKDEIDKRLEPYEYKEPNLFA